MVTQIIGTSASQEQFSPQKTVTASPLGPEERKNLSLQVLAQTEWVSRLAQKNGVSRKFLYQQAAKASEAIDEALTPSPDDDPGGALGGVESSDPRGALVAGFGPLWVKSRCLLTVSRSIASSLAIRRLDHPRCFNVIIAFTTAILSWFARDELLKSRNCRDKRTRMATHPFLKSGWV